jgi:hypothetical protein
MKSISKQITLPSKEEAAEIVEPIAEQLRQAQENAINDWKISYEAMRHILSPRAQSIIIYDHIVHHAKILLASMPGVKAFISRGIFTVAVSGAADIRFKKLDRKLRSSNVRTNQQQRYSLQLSLEGFADLPRLTAGYVLDDLRLALQGIYITLQVGRAVRYSIPLHDATGQQVLPFPKVRSSPPLPNQRRVRVKKDSKKRAERE